MGDIWVVNASPVIALAKVDRLHLLDDLCNQLLIPQAVVAEILAGPSSDAARRAIENGWGTAVAVDRIAPELQEWGLGTGETAVLAVAMERKPATAVIDDAAVRTCAKAFGIEVIGTVGAVLRARRKRIISSAAEVLKSLLAAGLWLDDATISSVLNGVGEAWKDRQV